MALPFTQSFESEKAAFLRLMYHKNLIQKLKSEYKKNHQNAFCRKNVTNGMRSCETNIYDGAHIKCQ